MKRLSHEAGWIIFESMDIFGLILVSGFWDMMSIS
jgi:hypothetical protein